MMGVPFYYQIVSIILRFAIKRLLYESHFCVLRCVNAFAENDWLEIRRTDDVFEPLPDGLCFQLVAGK